MKKLLFILFLILPISAPVFALDSGWYAIQATSLLRVAMENDGLQLYYATNKSNQKYHITKIDDGTYKIGTGNTAGIQVLTVDENNIIQKRYNKDDNQKWIIIENEDGSFYIKNAEQYLNAPVNKHKTRLVLSEEGSKFKIIPFTDKVTVTFKDNNETITRKSVIKGNSIEYSLPNKDGLIFDGWDKELTDIKFNITTNAIWREATTHKVIFMCDDKILSEEYIEDGKSAKEPNILEKEGMEFVGWDKEFNEITEDIVINAIYKEKETEHQHEWIPVYKTVHHDAVTHQETYTEKEPYTYEEPYTYQVSIKGYEIYNCAKVTAWLHGKAYAPGDIIFQSENKQDVLNFYNQLYFCKSSPEATWDDLNCIAWRGPNIIREETRTGYETKTGYRDVQKTRTVTDKVAYEEQVVDYYKCNICGNIKE